MEGESEQPSDLTARRGRLEDAELLASLMFMAPSRESVAMAGSAAAAERFAVYLLRHAIAQGTSFVIVAEIAAEPVAFAELSNDSDVPSLPVVARAGINAMGLVGTLGAAWRSLARLRVEMHAPAGGVHLVELQVSPEHRNRGVGAFLLGEVDDYAIEHRVCTRFPYNRKRQSSAPALRTQRLSHRRAEGERSLRADHRERRTGAHGQTDPSELISTSPREARAVDVVEAVRPTAWRRASRVSRVQVRDW